jgi:WD40 repeat protein
MPSYATAGETCRALAAVPDAERTLFVIGTRKLRGNNEVHLVTHDRDVDALRCVKAWTHHPEIADVAPCPTDGSLLATVYNPSSGSKDPGAAGGRLPGGVPAAAAAAAAADDAAETDDARGREPLERVSSLVGVTGRAQCVRWHHDRPGVIATVDETHVKLWQLDASSSSSSSSAPCVGAGEVSADAAAAAAAAFDPHADDVFAAATGADLHVWDTRAMQKAQTIHAARASQVRDVDYNPRRAHHLITAGDDGVVRHWDARAHEAPVREIAAHRHWCWRARFNPVYDQLIASCGSDASVRLWRDVANSSVGAEAAGGGGGGGGEEEAGEIASYADHDDSVYGLAWSAADPWSFASLSHDGKLALNAVPRAEKYKILL